jgi:hypothetical protein
MKEEKCLQRELRHWMTRRYMYASGMGGVALSSWSMLVDRNNCLFVFWGGGRIKYKPL